MFSSAGQAGKHDDMYIEITFYGFFFFSLLLVLFLWKCGEIFSRLARLLNHQRTLFHVAWSGCSAPARFWSAGTFACCAKKTISTLPLRSAVEKGSFSIICSKDWLTGSWNTVEQNQLVLSFSLGLILCFFSGARIGLPGFGEKQTIRKRSRAVTPSRFLALIRGQRSSDATQLATVHVAAPAAPVQKW